MIAPELPEHLLAHLHVVVGHVEHVACRGDKGPRRGAMAWGPMGQAHPAEGVTATGPRGEKDKCPALLRAASSHPEGAEGSPGLSTPTPRALHTQLVGSGEGRGQPIVLNHRAAPLGVAHGAHVGHAQGVTGGGSTQVLPGGEKQRPARIRDVMWGPVEKEGHSTHSQTTGTHHLPARPFAQGVTGCYFWNEPRPREEASGGKLAGLRAEKMLPKSYPGKPQGGNQEAIIT